MTAAGALAVHGSVQLAPSLRLGPLSSGESHHLGAVIAAMDPWATYRYDPEALARYLSLSEPAAVRFGIFSEGVLAGAFVVRLDWLRGPYLQFLAILPEYQRRGFGSAILEWLEGQARAGGERNLWVAVSEFNAGARALYERHGYQCVAVLDGLIHEAHAELLLRKRLSQPVE